MRGAIFVIVPKRDDKRAAVSECNFNFKNETAIRRKNVCIELFVLSAALEMKRQSRRRTLKMRAFTHYSLMSSPP